MPTSEDAPTELRSSVEFDQQERQLVVTREFQAFGTSGEVYGGAGKNVVLPKVGQLITSLLPVGANDSNSPPRDFFFHVLGDWVRRLRLQSCKVTTDREVNTKHLVTCVYSTFALADPVAAPEITINLSTEALTLKWDKDGNPIAPGFDGGFTAEVPVLDLTYSVEMSAFNLLLEELTDKVGKTNSKPWDLGLGDMHQWVFLGLNNSGKIGELQWRPQFAFRWYPPICVGFCGQPVLDGDDREDPDVDEGADFARYRGKYHYYYLENADGTINQNPVNTNNNDPDSKHGLQRSPVRGAFNFNSFFHARGIDPDGGEAEPQGG